MIIMNIKQQLYNNCLDRLQNQINTLEKAMERIQDAKNNETKSSAGDKYETGRAMMQMEEDKITAVLNETYTKLHQLQHLNIHTPSDCIQLGSLVMTSLRRYFIGVSMGRISLEGKLYFCISPEAPLAKGLIGKRLGEKVVFNGKEEEVIEVR